VESYTAWDLIGFDGTTEVIDRLLGGNPRYAEPDYEPIPARVRVVGGRTLYEAVTNNGGCKVRLNRLVDNTGQVNPTSRYVDPDTPLEVVRDG